MKSYEIVAIDKGEGKSKELTSNCCSNACQLPESCKMAGERDSVLELKTTRGRGERSSIVGESCCGLMHYY